MKRRYVSLGRDTLIIIQMIVVLSETKKRFCKRYNTAYKLFVRISNLSSIQDKRFALPDSADVSFFDYCLVEHLDKRDNSIANEDLFGFAKRCGCLVGIAHTDMFSFIERIGIKPEEYFRQMAEANIFWEMNVSYDSIHNYREHAYMLDFFSNKEQQSIIRESGVRLSIGFDGYRVKDYLPERVARYCQQITEMGIKMIFE